MFKQSYLPAAAHIYSNSARTTGMIKFAVVENSELLFDLGTVPQCVVQTRGAEKMNPYDTLLTHNVFSIKSSLDFYIYIQYSVYAKPQYTVHFTRS